ncbi:SUF system Fe-S cluster assembly regulator [Wenzhouxiangella sp. XN79A]|uniref:SUF system Fe-S cluster assembly regulator n=1 Tax=Wenzhouxiangella sp. XN79A TaxID=2724193 RepID=UPI00144A4E6A|nr:SUF system Fe-S cluster assembly regulator [Wenzhouxiangella sp. XN79A]NKI34654.1 SUF system Fe-S cluster assembly regulator [Wenzhouxiangella sp. XN79A]
MLRISKLTDYATVVLAEMAAAPGECRSAAQLAEATRLEPPTVAKVLKTLARAGLIESVRGVNGGYRLVTAPAEVSVAAIIRAMEGPIALTECGLEPGLCAREHDCSLRGNWRRIGETVERALDAMSLADLAAPRAPAIELVARVERASS